MNTQIDIENIKRWIGELVIENKLLLEELNRIKTELEQLKAKAAAAGYNQE